MRRCPHRPCEFRVLMVQTASVAYHDSLWVTVGAAAPVIALAAIVAVSDLSGAQGTLRDIAYRYVDPITREPDQGPTGAAVWYVLTSWRRWGNSFAGINIALQMAMLAVALVSLSNTSNLVSPIVPEIVLPLGVFLLFMSTRVANLIRDPRYLENQINRERHRFGAKIWRMRNTQGDAGGPANGDP